MPELKVLKLHEHLVHRKKAAGQLAADPQIGLLLRTFGIPKVEHFNLKRKQGTLNLNFEAIVLKEAGRPKQCFNELGTFLQSGRTAKSDDGKLRILNLKLHLKFSL